jgi:tRNA uracil 4-sulfurtransferase
MMNDVVDQGAPVASDVVVLRWAEIFLKGANRPYFEQVLVDQVVRLCRGIVGVKIHRAHARLLVEVPREELGRVIERLGRLFGLHSMSPARICPGDLDGIAAIAVEMARDALARRGGGTPSFKIDTNRPNKSFPLSSVEVSRHVGARVQRELGLPVDVHKPELTVGVEIGHKGRIFTWTDTLPGPGGLPVGATGRVNLMISGGIDSPVAGWLAMKRGCTLMATYFHSFPFTGDKTKEKVIDLVRKLAEWQGPIPLHVVHFTDVQKRLRETAPAELAVVMYRRMMVRTASIIAERDGALALVTGDNLAQVASQTLENLIATEDAASLPVLRPLLTYDKLETVALAQKLGTYETSILPYDDCCSLFLPPHPATKARAKEARHHERDLEVEKLAAEMAERAERVIVEAS